MDIDKTLTLPGAPEQVWALLLDPKVMGECVPGMQSIEVVSDTEYRSVMQVKIAFVSAKFRIRTLVVEQRAPHYLRSEGSGDDASVASSFKQVSEMFLDALPEGGTRLRMKVKVDLLGRLGSFGLNVMKTKADRIWDEFGANLSARLTAAGAPSVPLRPVSEAARTVEDARPQQAAIAAPLAPPPARQFEQRAGWFARLLGLAPHGVSRQPGDIVVELRRGDTSITILWPEQSASTCAAWLKDYLGKP